MACETAYIGFGSNEGDRFEHCDRAVTLLGLLPASALTGVSSLYETEPVVDERTDPGLDWFVNGVVRLETDIAPRKLLEVCREIERALGRDPVAHEPGRRVPRPMDLDLLFYGQKTLDEPELTIPHPRLHRRRFVLTPLVELAPDLRHPVLGLTVRELLERLQDPAEVRRLDRPSGSRYGVPPSCHRVPSGPGAGSPS
jgi:2-amino-4-hydroxy-6-hydroxymethyldihydropteridine diphosphokinase